MPVHQTSPEFIGGIRRKRGGRRRWDDGFDFERAGETSSPESLSSDLAAAHAMILAEGAARLEAEAKLADARAEAANTQADLSSTEALITYYKLEIEKLHRQLCGTRSEHKARLLEQMELQLEELEATEDGLAAKKAAARR